MDRSVARQRFATQKANAAKRGIEWDMTFEEWCEIWKPHWEKRGQYRDGRVMCRTHDKGPYAVGNVRIDTPKANSAEAAMMKRCRTAIKPSDKCRVASYAGGGFKSYGSNFAHPDRALEDAQEEYEWIP